MRALKRLSIVGGSGKPAKLSATAAATANANANADDEPAPLAGGGCDVPVREAGDMSSAGNLGEDGGGGGGSGGGSGGGGDDVFEGNAEAELESHEATAEAKVREDDAAGARTGTGAKLGASMRRAWARSSFRSPTKRSTTPPPDGVAGESSAPRAKKADRWTDEVHFSPGQVGPVCGVD